MEMDEALAKVMQEPGSEFKVQSSGLGDLSLTFLYSECSQTMNRER